jgi:hypothetical protein
MAGGIVAVSLGSLLVLAGTLAVDAAGPNCGSELTTNFEVAPGSYNSCVHDKKTRGYILAVSGAVMAGGGIPLIIWGAKSVPDAPGTQAALNLWLSPYHAALSLELDL